MSNYKVKQEWLEAVMASDLSPATKVYAWGVYQHMYGNKTDAWPGAKAIGAATRLDDSKYYLYNQALEDAGFLEVTPRRGRSNEYLLTYPPPEGVGTHPHKGYHPPPEGVTPTPTGGTNTIKNLSNKTTSESNKSAAVVAGAPTPPNGQVRTEVVEIHSDDVLSLNLEEDSSPVNQESPNTHLPPEGVGQTWQEKQAEFAELRRIAEQKQREKYTKRGRVSA
jgi:hypothetical protein